MQIGQSDTFLITVVLSIYQNSLMHPMLNIAIKAVRRAGTFINQSSLSMERMSTIRKSTGNYLSEVHAYSEEIIRGILSNFYPNHTIISENGSLQESTEHDFTWIIDSLNGINNFLHDFPSYAISVSLEKKEQIILSVIYDPARNELFAASRGNGTFLNNRRIRVSGRSFLSGSLIGTTSKSFFGFDNQIRMIIRNGVSIRCIGSTSLALAYVACGRLDGFFCQSLKTNDMKAGLLLIQESGGLISDFDGNQKWAESGNSIATTPKLLGYMINLFQNLYNAS